MIGELKARKFCASSGAQNPIDIIPRRAFAFHMCSHNKQRHGVGVFRNILDIARLHIGFKLGKHSLDFNVHGGK